MPSTLDRYFVRRNGKLTFDQYQAGKHIVDLNNAAGLNAHGSNYQEKVDVSVNASTFDNRMISKLHYVRQLNEIRSYVGPLCWDVIYRVCIMDERLAGRFQMDLLRESLQLVHKEFLK